MSRGVQAARALGGLLALLWLVAIAIGNPVSAASVAGAAGKRADACTVTLPNGKPKNPKAVKSCTGTTTTTTTPGPTETPAGQKRVAIVGAGASGSAAAFFLARAARVAEARDNLPAGSLLNINVFEQNNYIGGRVKSVLPGQAPHPWWLLPLELGATIYVDANVNLKRVADKFQLLIMNVGSDEAPMQIWDGKEMLYAQVGDPPIDAASAAARYGPDAFSKQATAVNTFLSRISRLYSTSWLATRGIPDTVAAFASALELGSEYTGSTGYDWATSVAGMGARWVNEFVEGRTRMNYGADATKIHGLGTVTSLATGGASMIQGGNGMLFEAMLGDSHATVRLNTKVSDVSFAGDKFTVTAEGGGEFDAVFWANPWHLSGVSKTLEQSFTTPIPPQEYVKVHVTALMCDNTFPLPGYFGLGANDFTSQNILTTGASARADPTVTAPKFDVLTYMGWANQWIVRLHSPEPISDATLQTLFTNIIWTQRQEWDAYPLLKPTTEFPPLEPMSNFHYLAALEPWISTMETQTVAAREAAARAAKRWWNVDVGAALDGETWDFTT